MVLRLPLVHQDLQQLGGREHPRFTLRAFRRKEVFATQVRAFKYVSSLS